MFLPREGGSTVVMVAVALFRFFFCVIFFYHMQADEWPRNPGAIRNTKINMTFIFSTPVQVKLKGKKRKILDNYHGFVGAYKIENTLFEQLMK